MPNKVSFEAKAIAGRLVDDPTYQTVLRKRLRTGKIAPAMETLLWYYAKGKPKDTLTLEGVLTLETTDALRQSLSRKLDRLTSAGA